jgi:glycosyltransferase involved in cell wall biosynthesis/ubiquinone/menaquinone biosynthesis C-methylase UbiE
MIKQSRKIRLPADLYSRNTLYGLLTEFILKNRTPDENHHSLEVLDVGGAEGKLAWFMPQHTRVTILDQKPQPEDGKTTYVQGDAIRLPFADQSFDLVISSDMLEHLPTEDRLTAFREMFRVSRRYVILAAPFNSIYNQKAEEYINTQFRDHTGQDHPFLIEHIQNGLPELEELEQHLAEKAISYVKFGEGNIYNWYLQQLTTGAKLDQPEILAEGAEAEGKPQSFNDFFNENLDKLGNFRAPTYRTVLFCDQRQTVSRRDLLEIIENHNNFHTTTYFEAYKKAFDEMHWLLKTKDQQLISREEQNLEIFQKISDLEDRLENEWELSKQKESKLKLLGSQINEVQLILQEKEQQNSRLAEQAQTQQKELDAQTGRLEAQTKQLALQDTQIRSQDLLLGRLKQELEQSQKSENELTGLIVVKEQSIHDKNDEINQKNLQIVSLQTSLSEYKKELETVLMSRSWKLVRFYGKIKNTLYTRPKNLLATSLQVLRKMGPKEFLRRVRRKLFHSKQQTARSPGDYQKFIEETELSGKGLKQIREEIAGFEYKPLVSVIMPVYNVPENLLRKAIKTVLEQYYSKWELCVVDDASTDSRIREVLSEYAQLDARIKVHCRSHNGGIVKASNSALKMAKGAYVAFMDNDDELAPDALYEVVRTLQNTRYDLIYSDEDKLDPEGARCEPYFKPDFDQDLFLSNNYLNHLTVLRRKIVEEVGGFRDGTDGSQDYDLFLRFTDKKRSIYHIPKILYHWRKIPGSTAATVDAKPYVFEAARKALRDAIKRRNIRGEIVDGLWTNSYRLKREITGTPLVSIIIPFRDHVEVLKTCLESIFAKTTWQDYEILLVNNASELLETREYMREIEYCPRVRLLHYNAPYNYSAINNFASLKAEGEYLVLLNNDTEIIEPDWIQAMLEQAQRPEVGAVGAKLLYPNNTIQHAGVIVGVGGAANHAYQKMDSEQHGYFGQLNVVRSYSAITFACMMLRKTVYEEMDGLDEENLAVSFNDVDFCLRLREKGYLVIYTPYARVYHHESLSRGYNVSFNEEYYLRRRHQGIFRDGDPYYNPNLSRERLDFSLKVLDKVKDK